MTNYRTELRPWLDDALDFIIEQIELARSSPLDQFPAVGAAQGVIPYLQSRLKEDEFLAANFALVLEQRIDPGHWERIWAEMAKESPDRFAKSAEDVIGRLNALKGVSRRHRHNLRARSLVRREPMRTFLCSTSK